MWVLDGELMRPLLPQTPGEVPTHSRQTAALPSGVRAGLLARDRLDADRRRRRDRRRGASSPFFTEGHEGFSIDYPDDSAAAEALAAADPALLPRVAVTA